MTRFARNQTLIQIKLLSAQSISYCNLTVISRLGSHNSNRKYVDSEGD